jgi:hypothetical protein
LRPGKEKAYFKPPCEMDILLENLIKKQIQTSKVFNPSSSYASVRRLVVDWMCELCEVLKF